MFIIRTQWHYFNPDREKENKKNLDELSESDNPSLTQPPGCFSLTAQGKEGDGMFHGGVYVGLTRSLDGGQLYCNSDGGGVLLKNRENKQDEPKQTDENKSTKKSETDNSPPGFMTTTSTFSRKLYFTCL